jgi:hypothetical protein
MRHPAQRPPHFVRSQWQADLTWNPRVGHPCCMHQLGTCTQYVPRPEGGRPVWPGGGPWAVAQDGPGNSRFHPQSSNLRPCFEMPFLLQNINHPPASRSPPRCIQTRPGPAPDDAALHLHPTDAPSLPLHLIWFSFRRRSALDSALDLTVAPAHAPTRLDSSASLNRRPPTSLELRQLRTIASFSSGAPAVRNATSHEHFAPVSTIPRITRGPRPREHVRRSCAALGAQRFPSPSSFMLLRGRLVDKRHFAGASAAQGCNPHNDEAIAAEDAAPDLPVRANPTASHRESKIGRRRVAPLEFPLTLLRPGRDIPAAVLMATVVDRGRLARGPRTANAGTAAHSIQTPTAAARLRILGVTRPGFHLTAMGSAIPCPESSRRVAPRP